MGKELTSSSPTEWLGWWPGTSVNPGIVFFVETSMSLVSLWILLIRAALASSSSSSLDCIFTWPSSNYSMENKEWFVSENKTIKWKQHNNIQKKKTRKNFKTFCLKLRISSWLTPASIPCLNWSSSCLRLEISFWYFLIKDFSSIIWKLNHFKIRLSHLLDLIKLYCCWWIIS